MHTIWCRYLHNLCSGLNLLQTLTTALAFDSLLLSNAAPKDGFEEFLYVFLLVFLAISFLGIGGLLVVHTAFALTGSTTRSMMRSFRSNEVSRGKRAHQHPHGPKNGMNDIEQVGLRVGDKDASGRFTRMILNLTAFILGKPRRRDRLIRGPGVLVRYLRLMDSLCDNRWYSCF